MSEDGERPDEEEIGPNQFVSGPGVGSRYLTDTKSVDLGQLSPEDARALTDAINNLQLTIADQGRQIRNAMIAGFVVSTFFIAGSIGYMTYRLSQTIDELIATMDASFDELEASIDELTKSIDQTSVAMNESLAQIQALLDAQTARIEGMLDNLDGTMSDLQELPGLGDDISIKPQVLQQQEYAEPETGPY